LPGIKRGAVPDLQVQATNVPPIWYRHAKFDHSAHRAVSCKQCHAAAYPDDPQASMINADVLVPGIANCLQCHAPPSKEGGGARFDCTECHRYHHADLPESLLQGKGAAIRGVLDRLDVKDFLSGETGRNSLPEERKDGK
jgi:hypothetical protein